MTQLYLDSDNIKYFNKMQKKILKFTAIYLDKQKDIFFLFHSIIE